MENAELFVCLGTRRYRVERPWGQKFSGARVTDVAIGPHEHLFVLLRRDPLVDSAGDAVVELDPDGGIVTSWGRDFIADAHMLRCSSDGRLFIVDRDAHEVVICSLDGRKLASLGRRNHPLQPFNHPTCVAFNQGGEIYVSDGYANHKIHRFRPDSALMGSWGEHGDDHGQFLNPHAVWVSSNGTVHVVDRGNNRVQLFTADGQWANQWTGFSQPLGIWGDADDNIFVTDLVPSLSMFCKSGRLLGRCRPVLNGAHGVTGDQKGNLYMAEGNPSRVTRLTYLGS